MSYVVMIPGALALLLLIAFVVYFFREMLLQTFGRSARSEIAKNEGDRASIGVRLGVLSVMKVLNRVCGVIFFAVLIYTFVFMRAGSASGVPLGMALFLWVAMFLLMQGLQWILKDR